MVRDEDFNAMLSKFADNLPTQCDAYADIRKNSETPQNLPGTTLYKLNDFEAYRNDIEFVNSFEKQLAIDEENYFVKQYNSDVYKDLKATRTAHRNALTEATKLSVCGPDKGDSFTANETNCRSASCKAFWPKDDQKKNDYVTELLKQNPLERPETVQRKVEYRKEAHGTLSRINQWMTFLYWGLLVGMMIVFLIQGQLRLSERWMVYGGLLLLPFLFPYLFEGITYIYLKVFPENKIHGPKNAFLEIPTTIESYNV